MKHVTLTLRELIPIGCILVLVVIAWTLDSLLTPMIKSTDLNIMATIVAKDMDPTLYPRDNLFASNELYRLYTPLYRWIVAQVWRLSGSFEIGLALLVPPVLGAFLVGMFMLFWRVIRHNWVALGLTVACAYYHKLMMGAEVWGVGGSAEMMSRTLFMPVFPFIILIFLNMLEKPNWRQGALTGLALGLAANLHPVSGFHLLVLLLMWFLLIHGHRLKNWPILPAMGLAALVGAWPVVWNFLINSGQPVSSAVTFDSFSQIVAERYPIYFFPQSFSWSWLGLKLTRPLLDILAWLYPVLILGGGAIYIWQRHHRPGLAKWVWLVGGIITLTYAYMMALFNTSLIFGIVGVYLIYRLWHDPLSRLEDWLLIFMGVVVFYSFVGYYWLTLIWRQFEVWSLTSLLVEYARAARFVYLPVYLLAGLALTAWIKKLQGTFPALKTIHFSWVSNSLAVFLLALILFGPLAPLVADYLPLPARNLLDPMSWQVQPVSRPVDTELYAWVQQNTNRNVLFYGCFGPETMTYFRRQTQRSITHNWKDLSFLVHHRATLVTAYQRYRELEAACKTFNGTISAAHAIDADYILSSSQDAAAFASQACFVNEKYAVFALNPKGCVSNR
ncbi:MAG: hypothetical protein EHM12_10245 [Dehalococcoidia bacterium]|nr:MAG: hypothetical protein EHM12_10245 [Dehalococcoidia bacterium]